ncbi:MAG: polymer-forming cytoskeletal protein [Proteobacteria bacterium]|nr:polymer-forming cytoskeletal protein [Pseudomonadota bacterium]
MFGKEGAPRPEGRAAAPEGTLSILAAGMRITGDLETAGTLKIDGRIDGSVTGARQVMLGRGGAIRGNVIAEEIVIGGTVDGNVQAATRLELQGSAIVNGDIETKSIVVLEGARINGGVKMSDVVERRAAQAASEPG